LQAALKEEKIMDCLCATAGKYGMKRNIKKIEVTKVSKTTGGK